MLHTQALQQDQHAELLGHLSLLQLENRVLAATANEQKVTATPSSLLPLLVHPDDRASIPDLHAEIDRLQTELLFYKKNSRELRRRLREALHSEKNSPDHSAAKPTMEPAVVFPPFSAVALTLALPRSIATPTVASMVPQQIKMAVASHKSFYRQPANPYG